MNRPPGCRKIVTKRRSAGERPRRVGLGIICGLLLLASRSLAQEFSPAPHGYEKLPFRNTPVDYFGIGQDAVARLQGRLERGEVSLPVRAGAVDLAALLQELEVPQESQLLVFAKNALNARLISPANPRALYFNDEVSVGWTPGSAAVELAAIDPKKGAMFYTLRQIGGGQLRITREDRCLTCHVSEATCQVPGFLLRSFVTDAAGKPLHGFSQIDNTTPFDKRWGGWYVTGDAEGFGHLGNLGDAAALESFEARGTRVGTVDLQGKAAVVRHLRTTSDVLPLLVHDHQTRFYTLLTRLRYEWVFDRPLRTLGPFVRCLLLHGEPPLPRPVAGEPGYRQWFEANGEPGVGVNLRELNLRERLFQGELSWLVRSDMCRQLPAGLKREIEAEVRRRLSEGQEVAEPKSSAQAHQKGLAELFSMLLWAD